MRMRCWRLFWVPLLFVPVAARAEGDAVRAKATAVLERHCVHCHNARKSRGGLDLTTAKQLLAGGDTGPAIVPGKADWSLLIEMVSGPKPRMPQKGAKLTGAEVASLKKWIDEGAPWPTGVTLVDRAAGDKETWWSLHPLTRPSLPEVKDRGWVRTPIDAFVLARLEERGLRPAPEADRRTLIRRLSFDLLGLPPTPEEVEAFVADNSPNAYERLVDRLLASPAYGERWARHWLDVVHYGDTHGYDKDKRRDHAWPYRDYVIDAFNQDRPYARFVREQLAGDVLYPGDPRGIVATGFIAAGPWDFVGHVELREGTVDKMKTRLIDRDDMVANTFSSFLSLTIHCARCHDHKFDPITTREYYGLQAVFAGVGRGDRPYAEDPDLVAKRQALLTHKRVASHRLAKLEAHAKGLTSPELVRVEAELKKARAELATLPQVPAGPASRTNGYHSAIMPRLDVTKWVQVDLGRVVDLDEVRLIPARPVDFPDTPGFGFPARFRVEVAREASFRDAAVVADHTREDFPNPGDNPVVVPVKRKARFVRVTATRLWLRRRDYVFALAELQADADGKEVARGARVSALDSIEAGRWSTRHLVDGFDSRRKLPDLSDARAREAFRRRAELSRTARELESKRKEIVDRLMGPDLKRALVEGRAELAAVEKEIKSLKSDKLVYAALPRAPRSVWVLRRGDVRQRGEPAIPAGLACVEGLTPRFALTDPGDEGARRAALAKWVSDPKNGLTWRSIVNRVWHYHFGRGIVDTPNDFGRNGSEPTHPALLDWLAVEFRDRGGSFKDLHRLIVLSAAYRQSSRHDPAFSAVDGSNRYLWRMNRQRLDAESVRDGVLAGSGQLRRRMGGPGFEAFRFKDDHSPVYDHTAVAKILDPATYRRTVYRFAVRSVPNPFLECLDCADPNLNVPVRNTTLTALQALALLNDPFMVRQSEHFADRLRRERADLEGQIERGFRLTLGRPPRPDEREVLADYALEHGLVSACRLLFNLNEFVFVD
jgi:mono/diheme cytochrome c family protein